MTLTFLIRGTSYVITYLVSVSIYDPWLSEYEVRVLRYYIFSLRVHIWPVTFRIRSTCAKLLPQRSIRHELVLLKISLKSIPNYRGKDGTRQAIFVYRDIEARSCDNSCSGRTITVMYSECVCSLRYPACNAHAPYCRLWPAWLYNIFQQFLINGTIFGGKKVTNLKCIFIFSTTFVSNISHSKKNWARYYKICISVCM